jgi:transcriptional regulator with XRE-family HTH domain
MAQQMPVADLLRRLRSEQGKSLRSVARDLGVDPSYLSRVERGEKPPSDDLQDRAARYYDVPTDRLELASRRIPDDIVNILMVHPELFGELRSRYGEPDSA